MTDTHTLQKENELLRQEVAALRAQLAAAGVSRQNGPLQAADVPVSDAKQAQCQPSSSVVLSTRQPPSATGNQQPCQAAEEGSFLQQPQTTSNGNRSSPADTALTFAKHGLTKDQVERYSRQLLLPSFGIAAQGKLRNSSVLIVGCGGLGSPAALYLAAAGIGRLGLVDHDVVELSNMHRQVIHTEQRLGMHKAESAAAAVRALNSGVNVNLHLEGLQPHNAIDIVSQYNCVIDASDNPPTRYLINDACVACGVPLISAAAVGTDGQLTVYNHENGPCYRCLFPECPAAANCSRCADAGVLGPVPGVMGVLQATEAIKLLSGVGQVLSGKLLLYDALAGRFTTIKLRGKAADCVACGGHAVINRSTVSSYDYCTFTGGQSASDGPPAPLTVLTAEQRITPQQLHRALTAAAVGADSSNECSSSCTTGTRDQQPLLLDVRPAEQFAIMSVPGAVNVPYLQFDKRFTEVLQLCGVRQQSDTAASNGASTDGASCKQCTGDSSSSSKLPGVQRPIIVMCRRGNHSQLAVDRLRTAGVSTAVDVVGGYEAWAQSVDKDMPVL